MHGVSYERIPDSSGHGLPREPLASKDVEMSSYAPGGILKASRSDGAGLDSTTKQTIEKTMKLGFTVALGFSILLFIFSLLSSGVYGRT